MQIVINEILTSYNDIGKGPVVLILHGWADSKESFNHMAQAMSAEYRVIAVDLPGHGSTAPPEMAWGLEDFADFVAAFCHKLKIDDIYVVIGHSNGGAIAIKVIATKKITPKKLVLLASAGIRSQGSARKRTLKVVAKTGKAATSVLPGGLQATIKSKFYSAIGSDALVLPQMKATFVKVVGEDLLDQAKNIDLLTLLVYGSEDRDAPQEYGQQFHSVITGSKLEIISGAGHFLHITHPSEVGQLIGTFLSGKK